MRDVRRLGIAQVVKEALELASDGTDAVALDVDLDVLDCPHAPGVCSPEPGGLTSGQLFEAIDLIGQSGLVKLAQVVELAPIWDPSGLGARMACYVFFTLLGANAVEPQRRRRACMSCGRRASTITRSRPTSSPSCRSIPARPSRSTPRTRSEA